MARELRSWRVTARIGGELRELYVVARTRASALTQAKSFWNLPDTDTEAVRSCREMSIL